jgi:hypothetical protein
MRLIECFCGVKIALVAPGTGVSYVDLYHGNDTARACAIRIPLATAYSPTDVPRIPFVPTEYESELGHTIFPFDIVSALRFWLTDEAHADTQPGWVDDHGRLRACCSLQEKLGVREIPVVNHYLMLFKEHVERVKGRSKKEVLPSGKRCIVVLTHDVDDPIDPSWQGSLTKARITARYGNFKESLSYLREARRQFVRTLRFHSAPQRHWLFQGVMDAERLHGFRSTFFFSVRPRWAPRASKYDVTYDIRHRRFRRVFRQIQKRGWEIGVHLSYTSSDSAAQMAAEKRDLEQAAGVPIVGNRHHYWRMKWPLWETLSAHASAGLNYDTSIAFNEAPGYRLGIAFPFFPWNPIAEAPVQTLQIPCVCMDGALFYDGQSADQAVARFSLLVNELKKCQGVAAIDWHVRTSYPASDQYRHWGQGYQEMLNLLAADREVLVLSAGDVYHLFAKRNEQEADS